MHGCQAQLMRRLEGLSGWCHRLILSQLVLYVKRELEPYIPLYALLSNSNNLSQILQSPRSAIMGGGQGGGGRYFTRNFCQQTHFHPS